MSTYSAGPGTSGVTVDPIRDFLRRQAAEKEAQKLAAAKAELESWLKANPDLAPDDVPSNDRDAAPEPEPVPPPPGAAIDHPDERSIAVILDESTAKNLLAFLPTVLFWFFVALSVLLATKVVSFVLPYLFALVGNTLAAGVWLISKLLAYTSKALLFALWAVRLIAKLGCRLLLVAYPTLAAMGGYFLLDRDSPLRRPSLLIPPPTLLLLLYLRAWWWLTWPVAAFATLRCGLTASDPVARREANHLAHEGLSEAHKWVKEGGVQRQWQQVLYGWESANPNSGPGHEQAGLAEEEETPPVPSRPVPPAPEGSGGLHKRTGSSVVD